MNNLGYIMEVRKSYAIIMTKDSGFIRIKAKPGMIQGITVEYTNEQVIENKGKPVVWLFSVAAAAAVLLMFIFSYMQFNFSSGVIMFVDVDINPSVEFSIDKNNTIIDAESLNTEGKTIIEKINVKGLKIKDGLSNVLEKSREAGFITPGKENIILISASVNPELSKNDRKTVNGEKIESLLDSFNEIDFGDGNVVAKVVKISPEERMIALQNNVSMGRYYVYQKSLEDNLNITLDEVKNSSVSDILKKIRIPEMKTVNSVQSSTPKDLLPDKTNTLVVKETSAVTGTSAATGIPTRPVNAKSTSTPRLSAKNTPFTVFTPVPSRGEAQVTGMFPGTGFKGEYYDNLDLTNLISTHTDPFINFNWGTKVPVPGMKDDGTFSIRWSGEIQPAYSGEYTFYVTRDNGARLWVDNKLVIDEWNDEYFVTDTGRLKLEAGKKYDIKLEYYNNTGLAMIKLEWSSPRTPRTIVPLNNLFPSFDPMSEPIQPGDGTGLKGEYFGDDNLTNLRVTTVDPFINFNWSMGAPNPGIIADNMYSIRWTGKIIPAFSDEYTFYVDYDDGVRLWINNKLLLDKWTSTSGTDTTEKIMLEAGQKYDLKLEYHNTSMWGKVKLEWSSVWMPRMVVPQSCLYPY